jgi:fatty-acyl-CoA synthase
VSPDRVLIVDGPEQAHRLAQIAADATDAAAAVRPSAEDLYLLIFTSGSTGGPKAVRVTQGRAARSAARSTFTPSDVLYSAMPLFHGNALFAAVLPGFASGATIALRRRFSASGFLPDVRRNGATFFNSVGRAIAHIVSTPPTEHDRDHHLRYVLGPETSAPDKTEFTRRFGVPVIEGYGSSENAIVLMPIADARPGTLGRANDEDDVAVVDSVTAEELPRAIFDEHSASLPIRPRPSVNWSGRRAASNFEGYYNNPDANAERTRNGWYWSGDLAYRDDQGIFYFAGRTADWLRVDSENFAAAPIERIIGRWPGVRGVAVYAVPDSQTGDQVMAALEIEQGREFDPALLLDFLPRNPTLEPSGHPGTSGSSPRFR